MGQQLGIIGKGDWVADSLNQSILKDKHDGGVGIFLTWWRGWYFWTWRRVWYFWTRWRVWYFWMGSFSRSHNSRLEGRKGSWQDLIQIATTRLCHKSFILIIHDYTHFRGINCEEGKSSFNWERNRKRVHMRGSECSLPGYQIQDVLIISIRRSFSWIRE